MNAIAPLPLPLCAEAITQDAFPEGVWRCPVELAADQSSSASATLTVARMRRRDMPLEPATVFMHGGQLFAVVDWPPRDGLARSSMLFSLDWATEPPRLQFGRRAPT